MTKMASRETSRRLLRMIEKPARLLANKRMSLISSTLLALFSLWDVLDVFIVGYEGDIGVEHGVAGFSVVELLRCTAEFYTDLIDADEQLA